MLKPIKTKVAIISLSIAFLLVGFQNCSKIKIDSEDVSGLNNGLNTDQLPNDTSNPVDQPPIGTNPPVGSQPPAAEQPAPGMQPMPPAPGMPPMPPSPPVAQPSPPIQPPMAPEDKECVEYALGKKKSDDDGSSDDGSSDDDSNDGSVAGVACKKEVKPPKCFVNPDEDDDNEDYEATCAEARSKAAGKISGGDGIENFVHVRGSYVLTKENLGSDHLESIKDFRGKLIICDVDVDKIDDTRGKLVAVSSRIGTLINHRGKVVIRNSSVDECFDIKGKLAVEGGSAVCRNVSASSGRIDIQRGK